MPVSHLKLCQYLFCFASICYIFHPQLQFCTVLPILLTLRVSVKHSTSVFARCSLIYPHLKHSSREKVLFQRLSVCLMWRRALVSHITFWKRTILLIVSNSSLQKRPILVLTHSEVTSTFTWCRCWKWHPSLSPLNWQSVLRKGSVFSSQGVRCSSSHNHERRGSSQQERKISGSLNWRKVLRFGFLQQKSPLLLPTQS